MAARATAGLRRATELAEPESATLTPSSTPSSSVASTKRLMSWGPSEANARRRTGTDTSSVGPVAIDRPMLEFEATIAGLHRSPEAGPDERMDHAPAGLRVNAKPAPALTICVYAVPSSVSVAIAVSNPGAPAITCGGTVSLTATA